jgi:putative membrane-bound dehydrogenase-like protein
MQVVPQTYPAAHAVSTLKTHSPTPRAPGYSMRVPPFSTRPHTTLPLWAFVFLALANPLAGGEFPTPHNSEKSTTSPLSPSAAAASFRAPEGFHVSAFASEPDVQQPIAMAFDPRGRLWVAENYTYAESKVSFATHLQDRILILQDTNHDGHFDKRTVFWDQGRILTSLETGMGGVFALCPPKLLFIPDRNGDDIPDSEPEVLLDGFATTTGNHHTFANGLKWGPDGWLWGRIGISSGARVGRPGTSPETRVEMRGGIWRFNPHSRTVEAVSHGTTNPWGLDWNELGEPFFINTVIGHLWHAVPGAHYRRMHGDDVNPHSYALTDQHADHYHFDTGAGWTKSRAAADGSAFASGSDTLGGGHAHCGLLIYQGDNWPSEYRGRLFTLNLHGRRINSEILVRRGSGYVAQHGPDLLQVGDPWFRGLDLIEGPDGAVYINDWSDTGECHDSDGVHRSSGRIYKVSHTRASSSSPIPDWPSLTPLQWTQALVDANEWTARMARRVLRDATNASSHSKELQVSLETRFEKGSTPREQLRALWALHALGAATPQWLAAHANGSDEHRLSWVVRLLADTSEAHAGTFDTLFRSLARTPRKPFLHLYLASALQHLPVASRTPIALELVQHADEANDHNLPNLLWQGIEPAIAVNPNEALSIFQASIHRPLRQFIARRLTVELETRPESLSHFLNGFLTWQKSAAVPALRQGDLFFDLLQGMADALKGWHKAQAPTAWVELRNAAQALGAAELQSPLNELGVVFGDGRALADLSQLVADPKADTAARRNAIRTLVSARAPGSAPLLKRASDDGTLRVEALIGLLQLGEADAPAWTINRYLWTGLEDRPRLLGALAQRVTSASALLDAVERGTIARSDLSALLARQIVSLKDPALQRRLDALWGSVRPSPSELRTRMDQFKARWTPAQLKQGDLQSGRRVFQQLCAPCHKLFGDGGNLAPDLTGSGRASIDYLLENLIDPNAIVPADYRMTTLTLKDGRVLNGLLREPTERTVALWTATERFTLERREIAQQETTPQSMMPEGLLESLPPTQARDLLAYLSQ